MRTTWTMLVMTGLGALLVACGSSAPRRSESAAGDESTAEETSGEVLSAAPASIGSTHGVATSAGMVEFSELRCIYRQSTGASDDLELQLQFLSGPNAVAFAAYLRSPTTGEPAVSSSGAAAHTSFEVYQSGRMYHSEELGEGALTVELDALPAPSSLEDGAALQLSGRLHLTAFALPHAPSDGSLGQGELAVQPSEIPIACSTSFQVTVAME